MKRVLQTRLPVLAPWLAVTVLGLWILWPVPLGRMPMSADHTVHLTRAWLYAQALASGQLHAWTDTWFIGAPIGDLYPILGDLMVIGIRTLSLGLADWPTAYALGFTAAFLAQGYAGLRLGRAVGPNRWSGTVVGLVTAGCWLLDAGAYREGGFVYTVTYGVWPQALATALTWAGLAELLIARRPDHATTRPRHLALAGLWFGAGILAHPMSLPVLVAAAGIYVLAIALPDAKTAGRDAGAAAFAMGCGVLLAGCWLFPMLAHRSFMASYGWLFAPLDRMVKWALEGQLTQAMPGAVGLAVGFGLALAAVVGPRSIRFVGGLAMALWLLASSDAFWGLRLDRLSQGFTHVQYQRFLMAAKPGLFALAGYGIASLLEAATRIWNHGPRGRALAGALAAGALTLGGAMVLGTADAVKQYRVGTVQTERTPDDPSLTENYEALAEWIGDEAPQGRFAFRAGRNLHWFMDLPTRTGRPLFKAGFTPGDNFVHKPESPRPEVLDAARIDHVIRVGRGRPAAEVARFGRIGVERRSAPIDAAYLKGDGVVEGVEEIPGASIRVQVSEVGPDAQLVFRVAGYPRWELTHEDEPIEWYEVPIRGDAPPATVADRLAGTLRGGKAHGDDGTEPTLIATDARPGTYTLRYVHWRAVDGLGLVTTVLAGIGLLVLALRRSLWERFEPIERAVAPWLGRRTLLAGLALVLVFAGARWFGSAAAERDRAFARVDHGDAEVSGLRAAPLKADMILWPAVVAGRRGGSVQFSGVPTGRDIEGWFALDDDVAKAKRRGAHRLAIDARAPGGEWVPLVPERIVPHRPGRQSLQLPLGRFDSPTVDVRVRIEGRDRAPKMGFDLDLGPGAPGGEAP